jgi:hypothetical protein
VEREHVPVVDGRVFAQRFLLAINYEGKGSAIEMQLFGDLLPPILSSHDSASLLSFVN